MQTSPRTCANGRRVHVGGTAGQRSPKTVRSKASATFVLLIALATIGVPCAEVLATSVQMLDLFTHLVPCVEQYNSLVTHLASVS
jgi:hypothetical protein